jgi:hypothetical protein
MTANSQPVCLQGSLTHITNIPSDQIAELLAKFPPEVLALFREMEAEIVKGERVRRAARGESGRIAATPVDRRHAPASSNSCWDSCAITMAEFREKKRWNAIGP